MKTMMLSELQLRTIIHKALMSTCAADNKNYIKMYANAEKISKKYFSHYKNQRGAKLQKNIKQLNKSAGNF